MKPTAKTEPTKTKQNVQIPKPVKNTLARLENVRGISSAISSVAYVEENDKALLSFTLDRLTAASEEHQAIFALKDDFVSSKYNSIYNSGVLSSVTDNDVTFYNCIYNGTTRELTVRLFPELSTGLTKISNQRALIILTSDAVLDSGDIATDDASAEVGISEAGIPKAFTDSTPVDVHTVNVGAGIVASRSPYGSTPLQITVRFDTNRGSANPASRTINSGTTLGFLPPNPTRANHTFLGWFDTNAATGGTQIRANTPINSSMTLWARWRTNSPTIRTPQDNAIVEHTRLNVEWDLVPSATYTIQVRNLREDRITFPALNLPAGTMQFSIPACALTAGDRHRVAVSAVTSNAVNGWNQREFMVRGNQQTPDDIRRFYINVTDAPFASMPFGTTNIRASGCGILSIAMIICRRQNISDRDGKVAVVQAVIDNARGTGINQNYLSHSSTIPFNGVNYRVSRDDTRPASFNDTIIQYRGHFVLAVNNNLVQDSGARAITTVAGADDRWGQQIAWWNVD